MKVLLPLIWLKQIFKEDDTVKKILYYVLIAAVAGTVFLAAGCTLFNKPDPVTIAERITLFTEALNLEDRTSLFTHFHEDTEGRGQIKDEVTTSTSPLSYDNKPFIIGSPTLSDPNTAGEITAVCTFANVNLSTTDPEQITFVMKEMEETVWFILSLTVWVDSDTTGTVGTVDDGETFVIRRLY